MARKVITVDGLAGSGKTSLSRSLAGQLGFAHLNSGLLYRAVGWLCLNNGVSVSDERAVGELISKHKILLASESELLIDGQERSKEVVTPDVSEATSKTSQYAEVRRQLMTAQREAFPGRNLVAEGRDMGTVIFPDAQVKFFVVASEEIRAQRRFEQLYGPIDKVEPSKRAQLMSMLQKEIVERDQRDSTRSLSPTKPHEDAIVIDNTRDAMAIAVEKMREIVNRVIN